MWLASKAEITFHFIGSRKHETILEKATNETADTTVLEGWCFPKDGNEDINAANAAATNGPRTQRYTGYIAPCGTNNKRRFYCTEHVSILRFPQNKRTSCKTLPGIAH